MFLISNLAVHKVVGTDDKEGLKLESRYNYKRRRSLVKRVYEKERQLENLDGTNRPWPLQIYLFFCRGAYSFVSSRFFLLYGVIIILGAVIIGSIQSYAGTSMEVTGMPGSLNDVVLYSFIADAILKIMSEGSGPHLYFVGPNWDWNCFDFTIIILSLLPLSIGFVKVLRLVRIIRLAKIFENIPELQMIVSALYEAFYYNIHIFLLLVLYFYAHADPWNFGSLPVAMLTMLRIATLDSWSDILYTNYYGCNVYDCNGLYSNNQTLVELQYGHQLGAVMYCEHPMAQPVISVIFFTEFIVIASFTLLALFIAALSMTMSETMYNMRRRKEEGRLQKENKKLKYLLQIYKNPLNEIHDSRVARKKQLLTMAFQGIPIYDPHGTQISTDWSNPRYIYLLLGVYARMIIDSNYWYIIMTIVILVSCATIGIATIPSLPPDADNALIIIDDIAKYIYLLEFVLKVVGEEFTPWCYFYDLWNRLDFVILVVMFLPYTESSSLVILRLLRLLRVLRLVRVFPQLQVIILALAKGLIGIGIVAFLLLIVIFFFGILGVSFFSQNDPWHFGSLHMAMYTLFPVAILDNWSVSNMYIQLYGCNNYPWNYPELCTNPEPQFALAAIYYSAYIFIVALIVVTLFIGIVNLSMEEAKYEEIERTKVAKRAKRIASFDHLSRHILQLYKEVFDILNFTNSNKIGRLEMRFGLEVAGLSLSTEKFEILYNRVDIDKNTSGIDFSEFLKFLLDLRDEETNANESNEKIKNRNVFIDNVDKKVQDRAIRRSTIVQVSQRKLLRSRLSHTSGQSGQNGLIRVDSKQSLRSIDIDSSTPMHTPTSRNGRRRNSVNFSSEPSSPSRSQAQAPSIKLSALGVDSSQKQANSYQTQQLSRNQKPLNDSHLSAAIEHDHSQQNSSKNEHKNEYENEYVNDSGSKRASRDSSSIVLPFNHETGTESVAMVDADAGLVTQTQSVDPSLNSYEHNYMSSTKQLQQPSAKKMKVEPSFSYKNRGRDLFTENNYSRKNEPYFSSGKMLLSVKNGAVKSTKYWVPEMNTTDTATAVSAAVDNDNSGSGNHDDLYGNELDEHPRDIISKVAPHKSTAVERVIQHEQQHQLDMASGKVMPSEKFFTSRDNAFATPTHDNGNTSSGYRGAFHLDLNVKHESVHLKNESKVIEILNKKQESIANLEDKSIRSNRIISAHRRHSHEHNKIHPHEIAAQLQGHSYNHSQEHSQLHGQHEHGHNRHDSSEKLDLPAFIHETSAEAEAAVVVVTVPDLELQQRKKELFSIRRNNSPPTRNSDSLHPNQHESGTQQPVSAKQEPAIVSDSKNGSGNGHRNSTLKLSSQDGPLFTFHDDISSSNSSSGGGGSSGSGNGTETQVIEKPGGGRIYIPARAMRKMSAAGVAAAATATTAAAVGPHTSASSASVVQAQKHLNTIQLMNSDTSVIEGKASLNADAHIIDILSTEHSSSGGGERGLLDEPMDVRIKPKRHSA